MAQWHWLEETGRPDQFNSLHEKLIARGDARRVRDAMAAHFARLAAAGKLAYTGPTQRSMFVASLSWDSSGNPSLDLKSLAKAPVKTKP